MVKGPKINKKYHHVRVRFGDEHYLCSSLSNFILRQQGYIYMNTKTKRKVERRAGVNRGQRKEEIEVNT